MVFLLSFLCSVNFPFNQLTLEVDKSMSTKSFHFIIKIFKRSISNKTLASIPRSIANKAEKHIDDVRIINTTDPKFNSLEFEIKGI